MPRTHPALHDGLIFIPRKFIDFNLQLFGLGGELRDFRFNGLHLLGRDLIQQTWLLRAELVKRVIGALLQLVD